MMKIRDVLLEKEVVDLQCFQEETLGACSRYDVVVNLTTSSKSWYLHLCDTNHFLLSG